MKIEFWVIGKTSFSYLIKGISDYEKRLQKMTSFKMIIFPELKDSNISSLMKKEAKIVLDKILRTRLSGTFRRKGVKAYISLQFARQIEEWQITSYKNNLSDWWSLWL
ncbi:MAG: 23S rRNA (pseudouridine(1915)-N(3))-methyltransferase RlmH [Chitinophagales bacterium]|nr:23S rRNA (pseudouridine(1915)-N(3))-methyltransferase RlmH [Chitinophagales bacterium]